MTNRNDNRKRTHKQEDTAFKNENFHIQDDSTPEENAKYGSKEHKNS